MEEKIGIIKEKFANMPVEQLSTLIEVYREDLRSGVQKEIEKAYKKIEALEKEKARLQAEIERLDGEIARAKGKLSNQNFVAKAPKKLVEDEQAKLDKYLNMKEKCVLQLSEL